MSRARRQFILVTLFGALLCLVGSPNRASAEPPGVAGGDAPPPPGDFQDDDFVDPGENFGFSPPANLQPPVGAPPTDAPSDFNGAGNAPPSAPISRPVTRGASPSAATTRAITPGAKSATGRRAPKLNEYLELDSSVKGLEVKNFDLPDKEIKDVVTLISKWTGKNFILDSKVRGKITILGPSQVTLQEAYQAFLSALEANGLTTVQSGKFIRIIESAEARRAPVETYAGDYAPKTDQFITRIFQLKYINADEVQREFRDLTTRQGKLFAYEPTNSIIITDTGSNIARIEDILQTLDVKGFETTLHVLRIRNTSSKAIAEMLGEIYGDDRRGGGSSGPRTFRRSALERTRGGGIISKIIPDEQTNSLVILANASGFVQLKQLVSKLDVKVSDTGRIHVYYCEYAKAEDLAATLASLAGGGQAGKAAGGQRRGAAAGAAGGAAGAAGGGGAAAPVTAELEGGVKITSDAATNSLVVTANAGDYQTLKRVIRKLDIPRLQVFVETALLEVSVDRDTKFGNSYGFFRPGRGFIGGFVGDVDTVRQFLTGGIPQEGVTAPIVAGSAGEASINTGAGAIAVPVFDFMGFIRMITATTNTSVLSTPQIIALDNEKAEFKVLDETPVQTSFTAGIAAGGLSGAAQGTIERQKTGIEIKLTPHVNAASKSIRLEIEQKVDSIKSNASVPQALSQVQVATTSRVTNTQVVVKDRDFVILGGLMSDKADESVKKVPLLGDIPILGWLFKSKSYRVIKTNLLILLHPRIIGTSVSAANLIDESLNRRAKFIEDNLSGDDIHEEHVKGFRDEIERQRQGREGDPLERYRNNQDDEPSPSPAAATQESELDKPKPSTSETSRLKPDPKASLNNAPKAANAAQGAAAVDAGAPALPPSEEFIIPPVGDGG